MTTKEIFYSEEAIKYLKHLEKAIHDNISSKIMETLAKHDKDIVSLEDIKKVKKTVLQKLAND